MSLTSKTLSQTSFSVDFFSSEGLTTPTSQSTTTERATSLQSLTTFRKLFPNYLNQTPSASSADSNLAFEHSLIVCSQPQLFEKITKKQKLRLAKIAGYQTEFDGNSTYQEFLREYFPRLRVIEKQNLPFEDPHCYQDIVDTFEKLGHENPLFSIFHKGSLQDLSEDNQKKGGLFESFLNKFYRNYRFSTKTTTITIAVIFQELASALEYDQIRPNSSPDHEPSDSLEMNSNIKYHEQGENRFRDLCSSLGFDVKKYDISPEDSLWIAIPEADQFSQAYRNYFTDGYKYSTNDKSSRASNSYVQTLKSTKSNNNNNLSKGSEKHFNFEDFDNSEGFSELKSEINAQNGKQFSLESRLDMIETMNQNDDLNPQISFLNNIRSYLERTDLKLENYKGICVPLSENLRQFLSKVEGIEKCRSKIFQTRRMILGRRTMNKKSQERSF